MGINLVLTRGFRYELIGQKPHDGGRFRSVVDREENHLCRGRDSAYLIRRLNTVHHRHIDIEKDDIGL